jgi:hypothetical protein
MNNYAKNGIRFVLLLLLQVFIVNNLRIGSYINPYVYVVFVLLLPFSIPGWLLLILGFGMGLAVDWFMATPGLHAGATLFMAFLRPAIIRLVSGAQTPDADESPGISDKGKRWFITYSFTLVLLHHTVLFFLEAFSFYQLKDTIFRIGLSSLFTELLILLIVFFISKPHK